MLVVVINKLVGVSVIGNCISWVQKHLTIARYAYLPANGNSFALEL